MASVKMISLPMPYMYTDNEGERYAAKTLEVSEEDHKLYNFDPKFIPGEKAGEDIVYLNAQSPDYYKKITVKNDDDSKTVVVWCLTKTDAYTSYSKRRLKEEARRLNIDLRMKQVSSATVFLVFFNQADKVTCCLFACLLVLLLGQQV